MTTERMAECLVIALEQEDAMPESFTPEQCRVIQEAARYVSPSLVAVSADTPELALQAAKAAGIAQGWRACERARASEELEAMTK